MAVEYPSIDGRDQEAIADALRATAPAYTEEWDGASGDVGEAVLTLFAKMAGDVTDRLDQAPAKHRLAFLDMLGFSQAPAQPALVPLTFTVSEDSSKNVTIPGGTAGVAPAAGDGPEHRFEVPADGGFEGTPAILTDAYSVAPEQDGIYRHHTTLTDTAATSAFTGESSQRHALCLGHPDLLNLSRGESAWVSLTLATPGTHIEAFRTNLVWEYYGTIETESGTEEGWLPFEPQRTASADEVQLPYITDETVVYPLRIPAAESETVDTTVGSVESRWIRGRIATDEELLSDDPVDLSAFFASKIRSAGLSLTAPSGTTGPKVSRQPDRLLSGDVPLPIPTGVAGESTIAPFGEEWPPRPTFYLASKAGLSKAGETVVLNFGAPIEDAEPAAEANEIHVADQVAHERTIVVERVQSQETVNRQLKVSKLSDGGQQTDAIGDPIEIDDSVVRDLEIEIDESEVADGGPHDIRLELVDTGTDESLAAVDITVSFVNSAAPVLSWEYWNGSGWTGVDDLVDSTLALQRPGQVSFTVSTELTPTVAAGFEEYWVRARLVGGNYVELQYNEEDSAPRPLGHLPEFENITVGFEGSSEMRRPLHVVADNNLTHSGDHAGRLFETDAATISPFEGLPDEKQTLYLGFDRALRGGPIQLFLSMADIAYASDFDPRVQWERVSDPKTDSWSRLAVVDDTEGLTEPEIVTLSFEQATVPTVRFGTERHWLRAVVTGGQFVATSKDQSGDHSESQLRIVTADRTSRTVRLSNPGTMEQNVGGFHLVFECLAPDDQRWSLPADITLPPNETMIIRFDDHPNEPGSDAVYASLAEGPESEVPDSTRPFDPCETTVVSLESPSGATVDRWIEGQVDPCERWLETVPPAGLPARAPPVLDGLHVNTGWARNVRTVTGEILGSSDGTADQTFSVATPPVLDATVWVDERDVLSPGERQALESNPDVTVETEIGPDDEPTAVWVMWTEVESFLDATDDDRVYTLDPTIGRLRFGDGNRGHIPPRAPDNIQIEYRTGGGASGNVEIGAITDLPTTIQYVDGVTNPVSADGGANAESLSEVIDRAPKRLRDRNRAVTAADVERVALAASRRIARVRCLPGMDRTGDYTPGWASLLVVPRDSSRKPVPSVSLKDQVTAAVGEVAPALLVGDSDESGDSTIVIRSPSYVAVDVTATVVPDAVESLGAFEALLVETLDQFLHPLDGGERDDGWGFGVLPCCSDLFALLEAVEDVDHVVTLTLTYRGEDDSITISADEETPNVAPDTLIYSGDHTVQVASGSTKTRTGGR